MIRRSSSVMVMNDFQFGGLFQTHTIHTWCLTSCYASVAARGISSKDGVGASPHRRWARSRGMGRWQKRHRVSSIHVTPQGRLCDGTPWQRAAGTVAAGLCQPIAAERTALIVLVSTNVPIRMKGTGDRRHEACRDAVRGSIDKTRGDVTTR
jgi:hypothetical protein